VHHGGEFEYRACLERHGTWIELQSGRHTSLRENILMFSGRMDILGGLGFALQNGGSRKHDSLHYRHSA